MFQKSLILSAAVGGGTSARGGGSGKGVRLAVRRGGNSQY
jgi:hypothetical protein